MHWLDVHNGSVSCIASLVLIVITLIYVVLTKRTVEEMRAQRRASALPCVSGTWLCPQQDRARSLWYLTLDNVGNGPAIDVEIRVVQSGPEDLVAQIPAFGAGLRGQTVISQMAVANTAKVEITCSDGCRRLFRHEHVLEHRWPSDTIKPVAFRLDEVKKGRRD